MVGSSSSAASSKLKLLALVLAVFAVFECYSVSALPPWGIWIDPATVYIENSLGNRMLLSLHCKSKDDDLGQHTLKYQESWQWSFKINYWGTTLYWCNFGFADRTGKPVQVSYQVYVAKRDVKKCGQMCEYAVRLDGLYLYAHRKAPAVLVYAWPK